MMKKYTYSVRLIVSNESYKWYEFDDYEDFQNWLGYTVHGTSVTEIKITKSEVSNEQ